MIYINIECCTPDSNIILYISCTSKKMSLSYVGMENSEEWYVTKILDSLKENNDIIEAILKIIIQEILKNSRTSIHSLKHTCDTWSR